MKGLLHSKRFKKLLKKWLCMYMGIMLLFTTVVTYSKYITSRSVKDDARVTKFNVKIEKTNKDGNPLEEETSTIKYRPTQTIKYYFTVDTTELEVLTDLLVTVSTNENFDINIRKLEKKKRKKKWVPVTNYISDESNENSTKTMRIIVDPTNTGITLYEVTAEYKGDIQKITADNTFEIYVGYSAEQITKKVA